MKKIMLAIALCISCIAANAQVATFEEMKAQLNDKSLPLINMTVEIDKVSKPEYTNATIEVVDPLKRIDSENVVTTLQCKVKYRGNTALQFDKKSFGIKLLNEKGKSLDANMFGIREDDAWILDAMAIDRLRMRNRVNFDVWNDMSATPYSTDYEQRNGTKGLFVELFINGKYHGLYCFTDKINRKLLGIKKLDKDDEGYPVVKGVMYKGGQWSDATRLNGYYEDSMYGASWNEWELDYPDDCPCPEAYTPLKEFIDYCVKSSDEEFKEGINERFYWQNFADYHVFLLAEGLRDNHMKNSYLSIVNTQKGRCIMVTPWDLDCSLGGNWDGQYYSDVATSDDILQVGLFRRLWNDDVNSYKEVVADRWRELHKTILSEETFNARLDAYANALTESGAWQRECYMWNGNPVELQQDLTKEVEYVKDWYKRNCDNLENNIYKGIESGIGSVRSDTNAATHNATFNIMGQKVDDAYKGIVISNGKKMLRK